MSEQVKIADQLLDKFGAQTTALEHVNEELTESARDEFYKFILGMRAKMLKADIEQSLARTVEGGAKNQAR